MKTKIILLASLITIALCGCVAAGPVLSGDSYHLAWSQSDLTDVAVWNVYSRPASVPDIASNYVLRASVPAQEWQLPTSEPLGTVFVVTATNTTSESVASNPFTNNIPASPTGLRTR